MSRKLVIWGASGHALVVADILRLQGDYELVGFLDDLSPQRHGTEFDSLPIIGGRKQLNRLEELGVSHIIIGFGNCEARLSLAALVRENGFSLATAIHPKAVLADDVRVACGTVIAAGVVINPRARIGENVIVNTAASIDHDCVIEDGAHLCPGTH